MPDTKDQAKKKKDEQDKNDPKVIGFFCHWCTSTAADLAGTTRKAYPASIRPIRVMCTGTVDPVYVLDALVKGADGVWVSGCNLGECHYVSGNYKARRRIGIIKTILDVLGLDSDRVYLTWISASEGPLFAAWAKRITEEIEKKGRNPLADTLTT
jgi:F420-non-reducing hydrogenase iron-sulfur subunit